MSAVNRALSGCQHKCVLCVSTKWFLPLARKWILWLCARVASCLNPNSLGPVALLCCSLYISKFGPQCSKVSLFAQRLSHVLGGSAWRKGHYTGRTMVSSFKKLASPARQGGGGGQSARQRQTSRVRKWNATAHKKDTLLLCHT